METPLRHAWFAGVVWACTFLFMPAVTSSSVYAQSSWPVEIKSVTLVDPAGYPLADCQSVGRLAMIEVKLTNLSDAVQSAAVLVELRDNSSGVTQFLQWQTMSISPKATQQMATSFDPSSLPPAGQYDSKVFVWDKILTPAPLSSPVQVPINC